MKPDAELFHAFRQYHMNVTQVAGNFYSTVLLPDFDRKIRNND